MQLNLKKKIIIFLSVVMTFCLTVGLLTTNRVVKANGIDGDIIKDDIWETETTFVSVRLVEPFGLRFEYSIDLDYYNQLCTRYGQENLSFGVLVAPQGSFSGDLTILTNEQKLNILCPKFIIEDNLVKFSAVMHSIKESNYLKEFTSRGYIQIVDGLNEHYEYLEYYYNVNYFNECAKELVREDIEYTTEQKAHLNSVIASVVSNSDGELNAQIENKDGIVYVGERVEVKCKFKNLPVSCSLILDDDNGVLEQEGEYIVAKKSGVAQVIVAVGNKTTTLQVQVLDFVGEKLSNAKIISVNKSLTANYTRDNLKLSEDYTEGINITLPAGEYGSVSKDVVLSTNASVEKDKTYTISYSIKVNDNKFGGYQTGFGYRIICNVNDLPLNNLLVDEQNLIATSDRINENSGYGSNANRDVYTCYQTLTASENIDNLEFKLRVVSTTYTEDVDITLLHFNVIESSDVLSAKIITVNDQTGNLKTQLTSSESLLKDTSANSGIRLWSTAQTEKPSSGSGLVALLNNDLIANQTYRIKFDVKKISATGENANKFINLPYFAFSNSFNGNTYSYQETIGLQQASITDCGDGTIIYSCEYLLTTTSDVENMALKITLHNNLIMAYDFIVTNIVCEQVG